MEKKNDQKQKKTLRDILLSQLVWLVMRRNRWITKRKKRQRGCRVASPAPGPGPAWSYQQDGSVVSLSFWVRRAALPLPGLWAMRRSLWLGRVGIEFPVQCLWPPPVTGVSSAWPRLWQALEGQAWAWEGGRQRLLNLEKWELIVLNPRILQGCELWREGGAGKGGARGKG